MRSPRLGSALSRTISVRIGASLAMLLGVFGACTTEDPREHFRGAAQGRPIGSGSAPGHGGTGSIGAGSRAGSSGSATGGKGSSTGGGGGGGATASGGDSGEVGVGSNDGFGGEAGEPPTTSGTGGVGSGGSATGGSGASAGSGAGPVDSCGERPVSSEPFSKRALRAAAADCAVWHYCKFEAKAVRLEASAATLAAEPTPERLETARSDWRDAMAAWSAIELFQFGPLASRATSEGKDFVHGQGLREFVYSWPRFTRCRVEEQVASEKYATQGFANVPITSRGLFGLEYLLFYPGSDSACAATSSTATTFASLDGAELTARKHRYMTAITGDVLATTRTLLSLWSPSGGNFRETFVNATGYADEQQALTILAWSLVYLEREVKDWKLGVPLGVTASHPVASPEAPFAQAGTANILGNLRGFRALFQGCGAGGEGLGFDDWLSEAGHVELGQDIVRALDAAELFTSTFPPLDAAAPSDLENFYSTIKVLTDYLKSDLFGAGSPLNLDLPDGVAGDTD
jgi:uncharacterized protein